MSQLAFLEWVVRGGGERLPCLMGIVPSWYTDVYKSTKYSFNYRQTAVRTVCDVSAGRRSVVTHSCVRLDQRKTFTSGKGRKASGIDLVIEVQTAVHRMAYDK